MYLYGLQPIFDNSSRVLILGSMPGRASLAAQEYYAHPQNRFWKILFSFFDEPYSTDYAERIALCRTNGIALWDAIVCCKRSGSLDATITDVVPADIDGLLARYPAIRTVLCNGRTSEKYCIKFNTVKPIYLPSTSPLNAAEKEITEKWHAALRDAFRR